MYLSYQLPWAITIRRRKELSPAFKERRGVAIPRAASPAEPQGLGIIGGHVLQCHLDPSEEPGSRSSDDPVPPERVTERISEGPSFVPGESMLVAIKRAGWGATPWTLIRRVEAG